MSPSSVPRKRASRIVPVVPLPFSRPAPSPRPITPENSTPEIAAVEEPKLPPEPPEKTVEDSHPVKLDAPLTPDSRISASSPGAVQEATPESSLVAFREDAVTHPLQAQEKSVATASSDSKPTILAEQSVDLTREEDTASRAISTISYATSANGPPYNCPVNRPREPQLPINLRQPQPAQLPAHHPRPSMDSIVFGARTDSPSVPLTPQDMETDIRAPQPFSHPPPGVMIPQFSQHYYGHSSQQPDSNAPFLGPPMSLAPPPPNGVYSYSNSEYPLTVWPVPPAYISHHLPSFSPNQETKLMNRNGHSPSSLSQSPVRSQARDTVAGSELGGDRLTNIPPTGSILAAPNSHPEDNPFELAAYLSSEFGQAEFADFLLQIRNGDLILLSLPVHGIIVKRSKTIASLIRGRKASFAREGFRLPVLDLLVTDEFLITQSLAEAIKHLYGAPFLSTEAFVWDLAPFQPNTQHITPHSPARLRMKQALSYVAAGFLLQLPSFTNCSVDLVRKLLRWDTVDLVLHFALHSKRYATTQQGDSDHDLHSETDDSHRLTSDPLNATLLGEVVAFVVCSFPAHFQLYTAAPELTDCPRLPNKTEHKPPTHNPRLSKIRFGDAPAEEDSKPVYVVRILSSLLLSLPFHILARVFDHFELGGRLGWQYVGTLMKTVVGEREKRRIMVLKNTTRPTSRGLHNEQVDNLFWEERVTASADHPAGLVFSRERISPE